MNKDIVCPLCSKEDCPANRDGWKYGSLAPWEQDWTTVTYNIYKSGCSMCTNALCPANTLKEEYEKFHRMKQLLVNKDPPPCEVR